MTLITTPNIPDADDFYAELLATHQELSLADSHALNAQLVLILSNHIGDLCVLRAALRLAHEGFGPVR